jgi:hypothetical protein
MRRLKESEKIIEKLLVDTVEEHKGWAIKMVCTFISGLPDRLVLLPGGIIFFAELKSTGKKASDIQLERHTRLRRLGFTVYVIDSTEQVKTVLEKYLIL